jgi:hypothetical protein
MHSMPWLDAALESLAKSPVCGYQPQDKGATEPSALSALALVGHKQKSDVASIGKFLSSIQAADGAVGIRQGEPTPRWPTSMAILAWLAIDKQRYSDAIAKAFRWALSIEGERLDRSETGHNGMLAAWPWVDGTHSWIEPSALFTVAFKCLGFRDHPRTREAVTLLLDRILPDGGCNYGNTVVLGQLLRPHVQPSGITMLALRAEFDVGRKIAKTLDYLTKSVTLETTSASLAWALLGLAAHDRTPQDADKFLAAAYERTMKRDKSPHKIALLTLAALATDAPPIALQQE